MQAGYYERTGPADEVIVVGEVETPRPGKGEVLVKLAASGVNPSDVKARAGARGGMSFPRVIPHSDGAGVVAAVGEGVDEARVGERVWLWNAAWRRPCGSNAEYVALPADQAAPLPEAASFAEGACLGIPAMTAHRCLFADGPIEGQDVLVTGGAGTVGAYAIQMAKLKGARVLTTVSSKEKADHARTMGADVVIDYKGQDAAEAILDSTAGQGVDRIVEVEFGGNLAVTQRVLKANGVIAAFGSMADPEPRLPFYSMMFRGQTLRMVLVYILPHEARTQAIADIDQWLEDRALVHTIARTFPLSRTAEAHAFVEGGRKIGATVIEIATEPA